jgi:uncharacterized protein YndB with AHSA1/START domain
MKNQQLAKIELLIRKPVEEVFNAFVDPDIITKFWFNRSSGPLQMGKTITWYWDVYEASTDVKLLALEPYQRVYFEWGVGTDNSSNVEWKFEDRADNGTYVSIVNIGSEANVENIIAKAIDSTGGFALVLAAAKAYLEHGIELNIVADRF